MIKKHSKIKTNKTNRTNVTVDNKMARFYEVSDNVTIHTLKQVFKTCDTVCYLKKNDVKDVHNWARNWIIRRLQHSISNLIRKVQCEDEAEFRGIFRAIWTGVPARKISIACSAAFSVRTGSVYRPLANPSGTCCSCVQVCCRRHCLRFKTTRATTTYFACAAHVTRSFPSSGRSTVA